MKLRNSIVGILLFVFFIVPALRAQDGLRGAFSAGSPTAPSLAGVSQLAAADFDSDQKPDGALLKEDGLLNGERAFRIEIHVTAGPNSAITFSTNETGLNISALDVNRDGAPDIVIEKAFTHERLQIYLNDGHGTFHRVRPEDYPDSDSATTAWRARLTHLPPVAGLPASRIFELGAIQRISMVRRDRSAVSRFCYEGLLIQPATRASSSSRAPPGMSL